MNPGASVKDRAALYIVRVGESRGLRRPGGRIVEGTAGNTGIGPITIKMWLHINCWFRKPVIER